MFWFKNSLPNSLYCHTRLQQSPQIAVKASDYLILERPSNYHQRLLELIASAQKRIMMTMLYLQDDEAGREIIEALYEAKARNPQLYIRVYVDFHRAQRGLIGKAASSTNSQMYARYAENVEHAIAIYGVPVKRREIFGVMHLKGFVFDDTVLYTGASINDVYLNYEKRKYRLDRYHEIHSRELADTMCLYTNEVFHRNYAVQDFSQNIIKSAKDIKTEIKALQRGLNSSQYEFKNSRSKIHDDEVGITPIVGLGKQNNQLNRALLWAIDSARTSLFICTPYFNPPKVVQEHLENAIQRGIEVTLVVGDKVANDFYIAPDEEFSPISSIPYVYEQNLHELMTHYSEQIKSRQLKIYLWKDGKNTYHVKGLFVDRHLAIITGNNLNPRAWSLDLENGLFIQDPHHLLQEKFMHEKQYILQNARLLDSVADLESFNDYPIQVQKILNKVRRFRASFLLKRLL